MYSLTYVSSSVQPYSRDALHALLRVSRINNERDSVTGMLLYKDGNFMQVLEGERETVLATKARIDRDSSHRGILVLLSGEVPQRNFGTWSMAFRDLQAVRAEHVPGYDEFLNVPLADERFTRDPAACQKLLRIFKRAM
jgi:hypothetical protein